jgi:hypothetical protein
VKSKIFVPLLALGIAATFVTIGGARGIDGPELSNVSTPNAKASGYAPVSRLSVELRQSVLAQGSTMLENPQGIIAHYGYENDVTSADNPSLP